MFTELIIKKVVADDGPPLPPWKVRVSVQDAGRYLKAYLEILAQNKPNICGLEIIMRRGSLEYHKHYSRTAFGPFGLLRQFLKKGD